MHSVRVIAWFVVIAIASVSGTALAALPFSGTGDLYVSMWTSDEIAVFNRDGTPVTRFATPGLDGPRGLAFHPVSGELWVAGEFSNALYVFDADHRLLRTVEHPDFNEPVGITFATSPGVDGFYEVFVSNSNNDEVMVFDEGGVLLRRFGDSSLRDPNCAAFFPDGTLFLTNRLGGSEQSGGAVARFSADERFEFDFRTEGLSSTMAVARDPNVPGDALDDTLWATSGAGTRGIHEFDLSGNLLRSILPASLTDADNLVPQGIAFADDGHFFVVSFNNEVFEFDGEGNAVSRFSTGPGTSRSTAFQPCDAACIADRAEGGDALPDGTETVMDNESRSGSSGGGGAGLALWALLPVVLVRRAKAVWWRTTIRDSLRA